MTITAIDHTEMGHLGACYLSEESAFGTTGTERRAYPVNDTFALQPTQVAVDVTKLSPEPFDPESVALGDKGATVAFSCYVQPGPTLLDAAASAVPTDTECPVQIPLRCLFGGESAAGVGSDVATGTSATQVTVTTGHGARFPAGQVIAVSTNDSLGLEVVQVRSRATDVITMYPALGATPATGRDIVNMVCYYPTRTNARSMSVAGSSRDTSRQYRASGCTGTATLKLEKGALATMDFSLQAATYSGPDSLSLSLTRVEDPAAAPIAVRNAVCWLQAVGTSTRVDTPVDKIDIALNFGMVHLTSLTGTLEGKRAAHRGEGLANAFAKVTLEMPDNADVFTWYEAQSELAFAFIVRVGAATTRRHVVVFCPQVIIEAVPEKFKGEGNLSKLRVMLRAKLSEQCTGTLDNAELAQAPMVLALG